MSRLPKLIGICGPAGAGKSTAAHYLCRKHDYVRTRFAEPVKDMLRAMGLTERHVDGDLKQASCDLLGGKSPREAMQTLGTEWGRDLMHPDLWTRLWLHRCQPLFDEWRRVVVDDVRFPNEAATISRLGGKIIRMEPPRAETAAHISERYDLPADVLIYNEGLDLDVLHARIDGALERLA